MGGTGCLQPVCEAQEVISRCCGGSGTLNLLSLLGLQISGLGATAVSSVGDQSEAQRVYANAVNTARSGRDSGQQLTRSIYESGFLEKLDDLYSDTAAGGFLDSTSTPTPWHQHRADVTAAEQDARAFAARNSRTASLLPVRTVRLAEDYVPRTAAPSVDGRRRLSIEYFPEDAFEGVVVSHPLKSVNIMDEEFRNAPKRGQEYPYLRPAGNRPETADQHRPGVRQSRRPTVQPPRKPC